MFPKFECIAGITIILIVSVSTAALNAFTVFVFIKHRNPRNRSAYLIINLAVADMLVGGFCLFDLSYFYGQICDIWNFDSYRFNYLRSAFVLLFLSCSLTNMTVISLERLHATFWPFRHRVMKKWIYKAMIAVSWISAAVASFSYSFYSWNFLNAFCLSVICISHASIFFKVRNASHGLHHSSPSRDRKLTVTLFVVTFLSLALWLPYVVTSFVAYKHVIVLPVRLFYFFVFLFHTNSLINPLLYLLKIPGYRRAFIGLCRTRCQQQRQGKVYPTNGL
ncbi:adenosine receptor A3-like [Stylophora pistillata]|uniref:adenosine receptor A3-like n=1 Tax=Stylophora pistillata TaxID=50429 RepID=UPI000C054712|nr:adenosine receptor A3-like [Stylophora pistillata]